MTTESAPPVPLRHRSAPNALGLCFTAITLALLFVGLGACTTVNTRHTAPLPQLQPEIVLSDLPKDADLSVPVQQRQLLVRGLYLSTSGAIRALPPDYDKEVWNPVIEKPGQKPATSQNDRRIRIDLRRRR